MLYQKQFHLVHFFQMKWHCVVRYSTSVLFFSYITSKWVNVLPFLSRIVFKTSQNLDVEIPNSLLTILADKFLTLIIASSPFLNSAGRLLKVLQERFYKNQLRYFPFLSNQGNSL